MWSDLELRNFQTYLKVTPPEHLGKAPPDRPLGAYDAKGGAIAHGFGRELRRSDFSRSGVYNYSRGRMAHDEEPTKTKRDPHFLLLYYAKKLSAEDWAEFGDWLRNFNFEDGAEDDRDPETLPSRKVDWRPNNRV